MAIDVLTSNAPVEFHQHDYIPYRLLHNSTRSYDQSVMVTKPSLKRQMLALTDDSTIFFFFWGGEFDYLLAFLAYCSIFPL